jgi:type II secretory pathway component PulL
MWWLYVIVAVLFVLAMWSFASLVGFETRWLSHRTSRRADDLYDDYADRGSDRDRH